ncbi:MAG: CinA family protein [Spirochaetaceae bacterium]|nr:CinA family protein [Spirochaetaceae bacterium]
MPTQAEPLDQAARRLCGILRRRSRRLVLAESCTGGLVAAAVTDIPGASDLLWGGFVVYSEASKTALLGVRPETIAEQGVVSRETALEMARGALARSGADLAVAVTGFAGPDTAPGEAAPGRVCLAWVAADRDRAAASGGDSGAGRTTPPALPAERAVEVVFQGGREAVRRAAATYALDQAADFADKHFPERY